MIETFAVLLLAHALADFAFQPEAMAKRKSAPGPGKDHGHGQWIAALSGHVFIHWLTMAVLFGQPLRWEIAALAGAHAAIDLTKAFAPWRLWAYLADQGAHLVTLILMALLAPTLWADAPWVAAPWLPTLGVYLAGAVLVTKAGGFAVGLLMQPYAQVAQREGLDKGGALIGQLERAVTFLLILADAAMAIGFVIAAKSILRFRDEGGPEITEYVIIGTLASFGWALAVGFGTLWLTQLLPSLP